jgi:hypothetical protein
MPEVPPDPRTLNPHLKRRHWVWMVGILVLTTVVALFYWARFETYSFCYHCALKKESVVWEVPFVHRAIYETSRYFESNLSQTIATYELADEHEHDWMFVFGSGNGSPLVFGTSRSIASVMTANKAGDFLNSVMLHQGRIEARKWLAGFRDDDRAEWCRCIVEGLSDEIFMDPADFERKLSETMEKNQYFRR